MKEAWTVPLKAPLSAAVSLTYRRKASSDEVFTPVLDTKSGARPSRWGNEGIEVERGRKSYRVRHIKLSGEIFDLLLRGDQISFRVLRPALFSLVHRRNKVQQYADFLAGLLRKSISGKIKNTVFGKKKSETRAS